MEKKWIRGRMKWEKEDCWKEGSEKRNEGERKNEMRKKKAWTEKESESPHLLLK